MLTALVLLSLGVLSTAGEWTQPEHPDTFLLVPRRGRVLTAKAGAVALLGAAFAAVSATPRWVVIAAVGTRRPALGRVGAGDAGDGGRRGGVRGDRHGVGAATANTTAVLTVSALRPGRAAAGPGREAGARRRRRPRYAVMLLGQGWETRSAMRPEPAGSSSPSDRRLGAHERRPVQRPCAREPTSSAWRRGTELWRCTSRSSPSSPSTCCWTVQAGCRGGLVSPRLTPPVGSARGLDRLRHALLLAEHLADPVLHLVEPADDLAGRVDARPRRPCCSVWMPAIWSDTRWVASPSPARGP